MGSSKDEKNHFEKKDSNPSNAASQHKRRRTCIDCKRVFRTAESYKVRCMGCWQIWRDVVEANEAKAADHGHALPSPETLAARSETGRMWMGYWYAEGIRPKPVEVTWEQVDEMLGDARLEDLRQDVERARKRMVK